MKSAKYNRQISLLCPTCGSSQFEFDEGVDEAIAMAKCASCGRKMTKDELIQENSENISEHAKEIGQAIMKDFAKDMRKSLEKALLGSKNVRIK